MSAKPPLNHQQRIMPPMSTPRRRQKRADIEQRRCASSPTPTSAPEPRDKEDPKCQHQGQSQGSPKDQVIRRTPRKDVIVARKDFSSPSTETTLTETTLAETGASEQLLDKYPISQLVLDLEKREQEAQGKCSSLEQTCHELHLTINLLTEAQEKEKSDHEAERKSLEAVNVALREELLEETQRAEQALFENGLLTDRLATHALTVKELEAEKHKVEELQATSDDLRQVHNAVLEELEAEKQKTKQFSTKLASFDSVVKEFEQEKKMTKKLHVKNKALLAKLATQDAMLQQLEEEKQQQIQELQARNESLTADLAAQTQEKDFIAKMLEEKTYESWVFRCAVGVIYKRAPTRDCLELSTIIRGVILHLRDKIQRQRAEEGGDGTVQQGNGDGQNEEQGREQEEQEQAVESMPLHEEPSRETPGAGDPGLDSEDLPLSARSKRRRRAESSDYSAPLEDTDDETPLVDVLDKRAKKLKTMRHRQEKSYAA